MRRKRRTNSTPGYLLSPSRNPELQDLPGQSIDSAPKDRPFLAFCGSDEARYIDENDELTDFGLLAEDYPEAIGFHVVDWVAEEYVLEYGTYYRIPGWWFVQGVDGYNVVYPILWWELPPSPLGN